MIFIDTGAFIARHIARDHYHTQAVKFWVSLARTGRLCFTSNLVLAEVFTLLGRIAGNAFAAERAQNIYTSRVLRIMRPDEAVEREALDTFAKYGDQGVSFTDCTSFVLMQRARLKQVFGFDAHFTRAGFTLVP